LSAPGFEAADPVGPVEAALGRLHEALAIIVMIDDLNMLDELPAGAQARRNHQSAVSMLAVLRRELEAVAVELDAAIHTRDVLARARQPRRP
jgi:hypothetical protein